MIWVGLIRAVASAASYDAATQAEGAYLRQEHNATQQQQNALASIAGLYQKEIDATNPAKCPSCGSRAFLHHNSRQICAYCRGEQ